MFKNLYSTIAKSKKDVVKSLMKRKEPPNTVSIRKLKQPVPATMVVIYRLKETKK